MHPSAPAGQATHTPAAPATTHSLTHSHEHTHAVHGHQHQHQRGPGQQAVEVVLDVDTSAPTVNLRRVRTRPLRQRPRVGQVARTVLCAEVLMALAVLGACAAIYRALGL